LKGELSFLVGKGIPLGLSGSLGSSEGANKIDKPTKPKTFALFLRSPAWAFVCCSILSVGSLAISFNLISSYYYPDRRVGGFFGLMSSIFAIYYFKKFKRIEMKR
jgi:energy-converting hydrogenase Eha subunit A